jgi:ABC-type nitrate/sulfonate/bicarbonate transport system ATPase subunit
MASISIVGLRKVHTTERGAQITALAGVDLDIADGELVAIVGPSGCGKTTLLSEVAGLQTPTAGEIRIDDRPVRGPGRDRGVVFQADAIFLWRTVRKKRRVRP